MAYGIQADSIQTAEAIATNGVWQDLATVGPSVDVTVGPSGRMLVFPAAACNIGANAVPVSPIMLALATSAVLVEGLNAGTKTVYYRTLVVIPF